MRHFNQLSVHLEDKMPEICIAAFELGLRPGGLNSNLSRKPVETMTHLRERVQGYIREEQSDQIKNNRPNAAVTGQKQQLEAKKGWTERGNAGYNNRNRYDGRFDYRSNFKNRAQPYGVRGSGHSMTWTRNQNDRATPLAVNLTEALHTCLEANVIRFPRQPKPPTGHVDKTKWCEYHRISGHNTDDFFTLKRKIEALIKAGCVQHLVGRNNSGEAETSVRRDDGGKEIENEGQKKQQDGKAKGRIHSIFGGFRGGGTTNSARKRYMHSINAVYSNDWGSWAINQLDITFTVRDFKGIQPHEDDPIVVMLRIVDYEIERVLLDQGSSADLIYGENVYVRGYVELNTVFGEGKNAESFSIKFLVVKCTSPYNVLIGRPSLNRLGAIISTRHLTAKYPLSKGGVGILKADQMVARKCYSESFKQYGHLGKKAVKEGHRVYEVEVEKAEVSLDPRDGFLDPKMTSEEETKAIDIGERSLKVGVNLTASQEDRLVKLLSQNMDLFAWTAKDLLGIDPEFICHKLALNPGAKPIVQFKRKMGEEKAEAVKVETNKLLEAGFIREVKYPTWLANVVMVKKANGKWQMCTDYTDLNKHCPKDSYPLPNIDKLVDRASSFGMLSLMDAYSGYHQIRMYQPDEEKTTFMTNQANYCYQTMPFGLKNAGATYQRLMDKVFDKQVGRNMEIYVDDMVVKSEEVLGHCSDLKEAFGELRKHNMRLNPEKCSFGIQSGKFLGFMITRRGIEVNPDKCKAILEMQSPTSVKDVQKLTRRIAALSRFLPCSGNKSAPFFQCLRKNKAFQWTEECERAFQSFKEHLSSPPVLSKPMPGISLSMLISISDNVVSSVMLQEIKGDVKIIYFVSHALQGAEVRYQKIEKAALALIISARKLRPYFQGFPVVVKTDLPLRQVLQKPDLAGRMVSWAVELSEFGITFEKKGAIKAQVLVDFVNEMYHEDNSEAGEWSLSVDGSSNVKGSGAGIILEGPGGAEYEAIIAGLKLAIEMGVKSITIKTDSQIVSRQIQGEYQAKDAQLAKYLVKAQGLIKQIGEVQINHVPRDENTRADILSKLASTKKPGNNKSVIQEVLNNPSIEADEVMAVPAVASLDWMGRIKKCLEAEGAELAMFTKDQVREASHYTLLGDQLYRRGVGVPLLRRVSKEDAQRIMFEVHEGVCASHIGGRSLAAKVLRA
ncbi:uncharacterized protein LOC130725323 [Lotus japonicus]|uniref:uncharacterized protein LOC130725323 n=1 Tax=Lotus japonicus TaxID=34305 RepID=UPI00258B12C2|nr:uncharacterized protein LOC130725323 [Lotus japonicus]